LREVALNLIFNAVDAMPNGGNYQIGTRATKVALCLWVEDSGVGMSKEVIARIFELSIQLRLIAAPAWVCLLRTASSKITVDRFNVKSEPGKGPGLKSVAVAHESKAPSG
jgi:hypothetical protein